MMIRISNNGQQNDIVKTTLTRGKAVLQKQTSLKGTKQYSRGKHNKGKQYDMTKATSMTKTTQHYDGKAPWEWQCSMTTAGSSTNEQGKQ